MEFVNVKQGSPEWLAHRAQHWNASDAPAMMACTPNMTRAELVRALATGISPEYSDYVQKHILDKGHEFEALARPVVEDLLGEDLAPVTVTEGRYSASLDGRTFSGTIHWEHKRNNAMLRDAFAAMEVDESGIYVHGRLLPMMYRVQLEHQCMTAGSDRALFTASAWENGQCVYMAHCWYTPDPELRAQIIAGWDLLAKDVAAYTPEAAAALEKPVGTKRDGFPALRVRATGELSDSNLDAFAAYARAEIAKVNTELVTDQDFADAELDVKWCAAGEAAIADARRLILSQTGSIQDALDLLEKLGEEFRAKRLDLDRKVKTEKVSRKEALVLDALDEFAQELAKVNKNLAASGAGRLDMDVRGDFALAVKGLKTLSSMHDALRAALAKALPVLFQQAAQLNRNRNELRQDGRDWICLFPDFGRVGTKADEDFDALLGLRQRDLESEQERQRLAEEKAREQALIAVQTAQAEHARQAEAARSVPANEPIPAPPPAPVGESLELGDVNALLAHAGVKTDAAGLQALGFTLTKDKGATLLPASDLVPLYDAILARVGELRKAELVKAA